MTADPAPSREELLTTGLARLGLLAFRPGQREAIETLLDVRRLLFVAPTGGGKSLVYQLPATVLPGTALVVSPLIALMHDQVAALAARGIAATYLAGTLDGAEIRRRMSLVARGAVKLVYVAPERLSAPGFRSLVRDLDCPLVAIDEAHCISEWGHDFRPDYMEIGALLGELAGSRVLACTATATPIVRDEILARLGLPADTPQLVHGFARPNLSLRALDVADAKQRQRAVDAALAEALGSPQRNRRTSTEAPDPRSPFPRSEPKASGEREGALQFPRSEPTASGERGAEGALQLARSEPTASGEIHQAGTAILYAPTRRAAEQEAERLARSGWRVAVYHAGLEASAREEAQRAFASGEAQVVVATNAFGMGIDRADVRAVIHLAPPGSIEAYYQEVGRAGRDGEPAIGLLLVAAADVPLRRRLLELPTEGRAPDPQTVKHKWNLFLELLRWAESGSCRHDAILRYFGDEEETLAGCGRCDVCLRMAAGEGAASDEETAIVVRKALSAVARIHGRFGLGAAVALLRGDTDERLARTGLDRTRTFGALRERSEDWLLRLLRRCITPGWVDFEGGDRPVALLTPEGAAVMRGERPATLLLPPEQTVRAPSAGARVRGAARPDDDALDEAGRVLFDELRRWRLDLAKREGVPPYVVASDRTLRDVARLRPRDLAELELAHGIGPAKAQRYGAVLLDLVRASPRA